MVHRRKTRHHTGFRSQKESKMRLNDQTVRTLPIGKYFDDATPAFGIRVGKNRHTWIVQRGVDRRIIRVGHYPAMTLSEARTKGKHLLASTQLNHDRVSFEQAYELFKKTHIPGLKPRTQVDYKRFLDRYYAPTLSKRRLDAITSHMVLAITDELVGTPAEQSHAIAIGKTFFKWCVRRNYLNRSPLEGATLPKQQSRDRVLTDDELVAVWRAAERYDGNFGTIVRLLILTGMRRGECAAIQTSWIQNNTLTIPKEVTKNGREHQFPIGALATTALNSSQTENGLLFPARVNGNTQPFSGFSQSKKNFDKLLNTAPWTLHDLQRTFATNLARLGVAPHIIERLINHVTGTINGVAAIYNRANYMSEMRDAVTKYEDWFKKLCTA
jgi:integrase